MKTVTYLSVLVATLAIVSCGGDSPSKYYSQQEDILTGLIVDVEAVTDPLRAQKLTQKFSEMAGKFKVIGDKAKPLTQGMTQDAIDALTKARRDAAGKLGFAITKVSARHKEAGKILEKAFNQFKKTAGI